MTIDELVRTQANAVRVPPGDLPGIRDRAGRRRRVRSSLGVVAAVVVIGLGAMIVRPGSTTLPTIDQVPAPGTRTFDIPPLGSVSPHHVDGRPVFIVHDATDQIRVLDAVSPHVTSVTKVLAWCADDRVFMDMAHGSKFDITGGWLGGPAPTGLSSYDFEVAGETVVVGQPTAAPSRAAAAADRVASLPADLQPGIQMGDACLPEGVAFRPFGAPDAPAVTHVGTPGAGPLDPDLLYPTPSGAIDPIDMLPPVDVSLLALVDIDDPSLKPHTVMDQTGLDQVWQMFDAPGPAPRLPTGQLGLLIPSSDTASCPEAGDVEHLRRWRVGAERFEASLLVVTRGERRCEVLGVRALYVIAVGRGVLGPEVDDVRVHVERRP